MCVKTCCTSYDYTKNVKTTEMIKQSIKKIVKENGDVFFTNDSNTCKFFAIIYQLPYTHIIIN